MKTLPLEIDDMLQLFRQKELIYLVREWADDGLGNTYQIWEILPIGIQYTFDKNRIRINANLTGSKRYKSPVLNYHKKLIYDSDKEILEEEQNYTPTPTKDVIFRNSNGVFWFENREAAFLYVFTKEGR